MSKIDNKSLINEDNKQLANDSQMLFSDILYSSLQIIDWKHKYHLYKKYFVRFELLNQVQKPQISIIIIAYKYNPEIIKCLISLHDQSDNNFELIFVNNGEDDNEFAEFRKYIDKYIILNTNTGDCVARNIGAIFAQSPILLFIDDDGIADKNLIASHINAHNKYSTIAVRGSVKTKSDSYSPPHYYPSDIPICIYSDIEGNTSYKSEIFYKVNGWDDEINFGGSGVDLSIRLLDVEPDKRKQIYIPDAILYHDYIKNTAQGVAKLKRLDNSIQKLKFKHSDWDKILFDWNLFSESSEPILIENSNAKKPFASICITTYNRANYLKQAIDSCLTQTYDDFEIIVIDDGSTDDTKLILEQFNDDRIKYYYKEHHGGSSARNLAIEKFNGDYLLWLDSDDILSPDILNEYVNCLNQYPDVEVIYCQLQSFNDCNTEIFQYTYENWYGRNKDILKFLLKSGQPIPNPGTLIKRIIFDENDHFNLEFKRAHDCEFWSKVILKQKYIFYHIDIVLYYNRIHEHNLTGHLSEDTDYSFERKIFTNLIYSMNTYEFFDELDEENNYRDKVIELYKLFAQRFFDYQGINQGIYFTLKSLALKYNNDMLESLTKIIYNKQIINTELRIMVENKQIKSSKVQTVKNILKTLNESVTYEDPEILKKDKYVNICIITYNRLEYTKQAIESLIKYTTYPHVITIIDNNSTDGTKEYLTYLKENNIIQNLVLLNENVGVAKASNLAWSLCPNSEYYLKLDNDIIIEKEQWLEDLVFVIDNVPQAGAVAYNFEPDSYPLTNFNNINFRTKSKGNIGGACVLIPKRTEQVLGYWSEEYGLYGEEDADYSARIQMLNLLTIYMEDENIGKHLPGGKAAVIDLNTYSSESEEELRYEHDYRLWKDELRQENIKSGRYHSNIKDYSIGIKPLYINSNFISIYTDFVLNLEINTNNIEPSIKNKFSTCIIIPVFNNLSYTKACVESIYKTIINRELSIIIIDNNSTDGTEEYVNILKENHSNVFYIKNNTNLGFAKACNQGLKLIDAEYYVLLNNDIIALEGWLDAMINAIEKNSDIGIVGSLLLYPDGETIQHAGVRIGIYQDNLMPYHIHKGRKIQFVPDALVSKELNIVTGACMMISHRVIDAIGYLDENYKNSYEDVDYCLKARLAGFIIYYEAQSKLIHYESLTPTRHDYDQQNFARFNQVWLTKFKPDENYNEFEINIWLVWLHEEISRNPKDNKFIKKLIELLYKINSHEEAHQWEIKLEENMNSIKNNADNDVTVSIIIPTRNNVELTEQCIASIRETCKNINYEIIIVDNNSTDETRNYIYAEEIVCEGLRSIFNNEPCSFAFSNNQGASIAHGKYLIFQNNDTKVFPEWIDNIINTFENDNTIGIQGAKLLYPNDTIQHAGIVYGKIKNNIDSHYHIYLTSPTDSVCVNIPREYQMVTGALLAIRKELFDKIGGFDEHYYFGHEDLDLCLSVRKLGYKVWYNPKVVAYHFEAMTKKIDGLDKYDSYINNPNSFDAKNNEYFHNKWQDFIKSDADEYYLNDGYISFIRNEELRTSITDRINIVANYIQELIKFNKSDEAIIISEKLLGHKIDFDIKNNSNYQTIPLNNLIDAEQYYIQIKPEIEEYKLTINDDYNEQDFEIQNSLFESEILDNQVDKKRLLMVMYGWNESGGGTIFPKAIAQRLISNDWEVAVIYATAMHPIISEPYYMEYKVQNRVKLYGIYNRPTVFLDADNPEREIYDNNCVELFKEVLNEFKPDIVHFHSFLGLSFSIADEAKKFEVPTVYTTHNYHLIDPMLYMYNNDLSLWNNTDLFTNSEVLQDKPYLDQEFRKRQEKTLDILNQKIDYTFAVSNRVRELLIQFGGNPDKISVINQIPQSTEELVKINSRHYEIHNPLRIGFIGGAMPHKGVHALMFAVQSLPENSIEIRIYGFIHEKYQEVIEQNDLKHFVKFYGEYKQEDLPKIAEEIDAVVIPSLWEDCAPLVIVESFAMGLPVIASNIGGIPDFISDNINGRLYTYNSVNELADILLEITNNPDILYKWQSNCKLPYSFDDYINHISTIYNKLINGERPNAVEFNLIYKQGNIITNINNNNKTMQNQNPALQKTITLSNEDIELGNLPTFMQLNLGCGLDIRPDYLNIDISKFTPEVLKMDVRKTNFPDNSVDKILASQVLQCFPRASVKRVLNEWFRILKINGELEIYNYSLKQIMKAFLDGNIDNEEMAKMLFGEQITSSDFNNNGFDFEYVVDALKLAKFEIESIKYANDLTNKFTFYIKAIKTDKNLVKIESKINNDKALKTNIIENKDNIIQNNYPLLNVVWEGSQLVYHSLALINREQCSNIIDTGLANVTIIPYETEQFMPEGNPKYEKLMQHDIRYKPDSSEDISKLPYIWIRHTWPPKFEIPKGAKWVIMQPWEYSTLPKAYADGFKMADEIWTPSNHSRQCFINSGLEFNKVQVVPNGIDPKLFTPLGDKYNIISNKRLKLLYIGGTIFRKGIDVLLQAYLKTFTANDDICLVIKDMGGDSFYKGQTAKEYIQRIRNDENAPEIVYYDDNFTEQQIADLYRACDVFVSPYRAEGFSLPSLEAMACGLPVIVTQGGATDDFVDSSVGWVISSEKRSIGNKINDLELTDEAFVLEPQLESLCDLLKFVYINPNSVTQRGINASLRARTNWTWNRATIKIFARLDALYNTSMAQQAENKLEDIIDAPILIGKADELFNNQQFNDAIDNYISAIQSNMLNNKLLLYSYNKIALSNLNLGNYEKSEEYINISKSITNLNPDADFIKAKHYIIQEKFDDALELFTTIFDNWKNIKFYSTIGIKLDDLLCETAFCFYQYNDLDGAIQLYTKALEFNNENAEACLGAGRCFSKAGANQEAQNMLEWALKLNPELSEASILLKDI